LVVICGAIRPAGSNTHEVEGKFQERRNGSLSDLVERWSTWYGVNQTKFAFWLLYSAALCDDLGLPNYKTLARRAWNRFCKAIQRRKVFGDLGL
jgi:hypothetical protein